MTFKELLTELDACEDSRKWAGEMTIEEVVATCHRGDWLLWLANKVGVEKRLMVLAGGLCANTVRHFMQDKRSTNAVDVCIRYGRGEATNGELEASWAAARAAAWAAAWDAAEEAARAAAWAAARAAAWDAAWAAARDAARAMAENQRQTADIARAVCGKRIVELVNQLLK